MPKTLLSWPALLCLCFGFVLASGTPAQAKLSDPEFKKLSAKARTFMKRGGDAIAKRHTVSELGKADSARAVEVLVRWAIASEATCEAKLKPAAEKLKAKYDEYRAKLVKKHGEAVSGLSKGETKRLDSRRGKYDDANRLVVNEINLQAEMAAGIRATKEKAAIAWLADEGVPALLAAGGVVPVLEGCVDVLLAQPPTVSAKAILGAVEHELAPYRRIRVIEWIGLELVAEASPHLAPALTARSMLVRRAAVRIYKELDDPQSVPFLIAGLATASGLLASEIEDALHNFTKHTYEGDHNAWTRWWKAEGEAWLAAASKERYGARAAHGDAGFYGIPTPSKRIVFLLDRSGSMERPIVSQGTAVEAGGASKLKLAKDELRRAINRLASDVKFNVLFYNHEVKAWKATPELADATRENKAEARAWFMKQPPVGSTALFPGLGRALGYAEQLDDDEEDRGPGVDTIFLLSDGQPTNAENQLMKPDELKAALAAFLTANGAAHCVVHTIGIGPDHDKQLMKRIADATGGTYVAVGVK